MNKKAYVRTLEAFFAFFLTFLFVIFIANKGEVPKPLNNDIDILSSLEERDDFRLCVYDNNATCIQNLADPLIPPKYEFKMSIDRPVFSTVQRDVFTETLFVSSNISSKYHTVYFYYWFKE